MEIGDLVVIKNLLINPADDIGVVGIIFERCFHDFPYQDESWFLLQTNSETLSYHEDRLELINESK